MTPGRSLSANTSGRSMAPVARTTCLARTFHRRSRDPLAASGRSGLAPFQQRQVVVLVIPERRRPREHPDIIHAGELLRRRRGPIERRAALDDGALGQQLTAELGLLIGEDDPRAGAPGGERRGQSRRTAADDQHVAMGVHLVVDVGIGLGRRLAEAGGAANDALVSHPGAGRPHERLVVEPGGHERREPLGHRTQVVVHARPAIDAFGAQPVIKLDHGGGDIGLRAGARSQLDQRVGLLDTGRDDTARAMVFETPPHHR